MCSLRFVELVQLCCKISIAHFTVQCNIFMRCVLLCAVPTNISPSSGGYAATFPTGEGLKRRETDGALRDAHILRIPGREHTSLAPSVRGLSA